MNRRNRRFPIRHLAALVLAVYSLSLATTGEAVEIVEREFEGMPLMVTSDAFGTHTTSPGVPAFGVDHDGVAELLISFGGGVGRCSGSLLADGGRDYVLTAAHCVGGATSATVTFETTGGTKVSTVSSSSQFLAHPNWTGSTFAGYDVALLELDATADPLVPGYELNRSVNEIGQQIVMVGYGNTGYGGTGQAVGTGGTKRAGLNLVDAEGLGSFGVGGITNSDTQLTFDFDSGSPANDAFALNLGFPQELGFGNDEIGLGQGDSGGPSFIDDGGTWKIAGVHSHGFTLGGHQGDVDGGLNLSWGEFQGDGRINHPQVLSWLDSVLLPPDFASNASFDSVSDVDVLNLDFGSVATGSAASPLAVDISNLVGGVGITADLDLTSVAGSGDTTVLTTDIAPFTGLDAGSTNNFSAFIDTSGLGAYSASYDLSFTDELGTNQTLTLNLSGTLANVDDPAKPDLFYNPATGEVHLDPRDSGGLIAYVLKSNDEFTGANHTPIFTGGVATSLDGEVSEATLTPLTTPGSIGLVFPTGLDVVGVAAMITTNDASAALGAPLTSFDFDYTCGAGDVNCDGFVDVSNDILPAFSQFTGPGSFSLLRENGDVNGANGLGDDDVDVTDLLDILSNFTGPPPDEAGFGAPAEAGDPAIPDLIYDPTTGEVVLDFDGSSIIGYSLQNATNSFLPAGHTPILAGVATALTSQLEEAALAPGSGSIGFVFPTGLDLAGLQALLSVNQVSRFLGAPLVPFDLVVLSSGPVVPEPSTFVLWTVALGTLGLVAARRRRS
ncbi:MAG: hypothetical protein DWQ42_02750 [Planctomycetota bacterium]|nr:MAG: hypothetical protein DWQ42_02750 [Planctomycetota bacterium]REK47989.1 MAG: hypothetical protein DWQ46_03605 [Planctomycetota bacterium]